MAIQLSFQCDESWDKMPNIEQEKFCNKCSKNIHDLTDKTESEIHQLYKENNGQLCGKIRPQQLNNSNYRQQRTKLAKFCLALFLVFGGYIFKSDLQAQSNANDSTEIILEDSIEYHTLNGIVIDENTNDPILFATVYYEIDGIKHGTSTDFDGNFTLNIGKKTIPSDSIDLCISYVGYNDLKILGFDLKSNSKNEFHLKQQVYEIHQLRHTVGMIRIDQHVIDRDPLSHGRTIIISDELRRSPY
tara:strand:- start:4673 stop:5407 length:735 start_codon:yes stop_codon:yes gene_type:complete